MIFQVDHKMPTFVQQYSAVLFPQVPVTQQQKRNIIQLLQQWHLLPVHPNCGAGHQMNLRSRPVERDGYRFRCTVRHCRQQATRGLRIGTFFEGFGYDLGQLVYAIYLWTQRLTGQEISNITGIDPRIVVKIRAKLRRTCTNDLRVRPIWVDGGGGWTVQIDESLFNHKAKRVGGRARGRRARQQIWVFGKLKVFYCMNHANIIY